MTTTAALAMPDSSRPPQSAGAARATIVLIALALLGGTAARTVLSPVQELMKIELALSDNQVSLLQGAAVSLPLALVLVPIGRLVDRASRARLLVLLALLGTVGCLMTALAQGFATMCLARALVGVAMGAALPAAVSLGADLSTAATRGRVMAVLGTGQMIGVAGAFLLTSHLLQRLPATFELAPGWAPLAGWRQVQLIFALVMALVTLVLALLLREPPRREVEQAEGQGLRAQLSELARYWPVLVPLQLGMISVGMADAAANIWAVPMLSRTFHLQPAQFGAWMGLLLMTSGLLGVVIGGLLGDLGQRIAGRPGLLGAAMALAALATPMALFPLAPSVLAFATMFGLLMLLGAATGIVATTAFSVVIPNELRGTSLSLAATLNIVVGHGISPTLVSFVAQLAGYGEDLRMPLTLVGLATSLLSVAAYGFAVAAARRAAT